MMRLSKYFSPKECACKGSNCCGGAYPMDSEFMRRMDLVREEAGVPLYVNSAFRCLKHNKRIGGVSKSWHTRGRAMDVHGGKKITLEELGAIAQKHFKEVLIYVDKGFVHMAYE